jgi:hypothetical protein
MTDRNYIYSGPLSGVTLAGGREIMLRPGKSVVMPDDSPYTQRLQARGFLELQVEVEVIVGEEPATKLLKPARKSAPASPAPASSAASPSAPTAPGMATKKDGE